MAKTAAQRTRSVKARPTQQQALRERRRELQRIVREQKTIVRLAREIRRRSDLMDNELLDLAHEIADRHKAPAPAADAHEDVPEPQFPL